MTEHRTAAADGEDSGARSNVQRAITTLVRLRRNGSLATLAGGATLAWAVKTSRESRTRAVVQALAGVALLALGRRQRRARRRADRIETGSDARRTEDGEKAVSDEAHAEATQDIGAGRVADESQSVYQSETEPNPRGMTDRADVDGDDGGNVDFVEGKDPSEHQSTHLNGEHDTRLESGDDEQTAVDLSEAAMADEASEAVGPHPEQAYPAREGTDPEPKSEKSPPRVNERSSLSEDADGDDRTEEADADDPTEDADGDDGDRAEDGHQGEDEHREERDESAESL